MVGPSSLRMVVAASVAIVVLGSCSGNGSRELELSPSSGTAHLGTAHGSLRDANAGAALKYLAVSDEGTSAVEILNRNYKLVRSIKKGLTTPAGDWYDRSGNLYVVNFSGNVQEYAPGASSPKSTYSTGLVAPLNGTTDDSLNVYVADPNIGYQGTVTEYAQGSNAILYQCGAGAASYDGVAVDDSGDVFVSFNIKRGAGIIEYRHGLKGCKETGLGVSPSSAFALVIDNKNNLILCDQNAGVVDVIAPPYGKITRQITGFSSPSNVALNQDNTLAFVVDSGKNEVVVDEYPSWKRVTVVGKGNGLSNPSGVAPDPPELLDRLRAKSWVSVKS